MNTITENTFMKKRAQVRVIIGKNSGTKETIYIIINIIDYLVILIFLQDTV